MFFFQPQNSHFLTILPYYSLCKIDHFCHFSKSCHLWNISFFFSHFYNLRKFYFARRGCNFAELIFYDPRKLTEPKNSLSTRKYSLAGIYADGPGAYLFHGVVEQQYIFHVMDHALCLRDSKQESCTKHVTRGGHAQRTSTSSPGPSIQAAVVITSLLVLLRYSAF